MTTRKIALHEIAHARAGDKGNTSNVYYVVLTRAIRWLITKQLTGEADQGVVSPI